MQHDGVYWIPNAPSDRLNEFQPLAEQELLFLFVATGSGALFALPQFVAELAILVAVYGASRRLGFDVRAAACAAFLLATFSLVALQSTTAQNDLVAASFPVSRRACCSATGRAELALAGVRRRWAPAPSSRRFSSGRSCSCCSGSAGGRRSRRRRRRRGRLLAVGMWGYVLNAANTGHLLGDGASRTETSATPSFPGTLKTRSTSSTARSTSRSLEPARLLARGAGVSSARSSASDVPALGPRAALLTGSCVAVPLLAPRS